MSNNNSLLSSHIYVDCMQMLALINEIVCGMSAWQKGCLGSRLFDTMTTATLCYSRAYNERKDRLANVDRCISAFDEVVILIRCGVEVKCINENMMARLFILIDKIVEGLDKYRGFAARGGQIDASSNYGGSDAI